MKYIDDDKNIQELLQIKLLLFSGFQGFCQLFRNSQSKGQLLTIPCQRLFVPNLVFLDVVLGKSFQENSCSESFYKTGGDK